MIDTPPALAAAARTEAAPAGPSTPLRVALVTETFPPELNGVAMTVRRMLDGLLRRHHRVHLTRPRQHRGERAQGDGRLTELLVPGLPLPRYSQLRMGLSANAALARAWRGWRPDVVHVVTEGPLGWSALTAARRLHLPVTSDFHTNFDSYSAHYGLAFLRRGIGAYLRGFHNRTRCTFVPTRELRELLRAEGYRDVEVVARGVDTRLFTPQRRDPALRASWGAAPDDPVVIHVGRIAPEKNLPLLLSAFEAVKRAAPRARLVLVGDGPARARMLKAHPGHVYAGERRGEDLAAHYASADLFLFSSTTETFGNVTVEAMASGLAVAAYDYAAAREHIVHGNSGWLAPLNDAAAFERAALALVAEPSRTRAMRRNARAAAERIDWDSVTDKFAAQLARHARIPGDA